MQDPRKVICNLGWFPNKPKAEQTVPSGSSGSLSQAVKRLETVEARLRTGSHLGWKWKFARREHDADIIANEVLPVLHQMEENDKVNLNERSE